MFAEITFSEYIVIFLGLLCILMPYIYMPKSIWDRNTSLRKKAVGLYSLLSFMILIALFLIFNHRTLSENHIPNYPIYSAMFASAICFYLLRKTKDDYDNGNYEELDEEEKENENNSDNNQYVN